MSKARWLQEGLRLLETQGPSALAVERLTAELGVTKGSFYWHFDSQGDFLKALTQKWIADATHSVGEYLNSLDLPPREMLGHAIRQIVEPHRAKMDVHFRGLAISNPEVKALIEEMDAYRTSVIKELIRALGYSGDELDARTHAFVVLHSAEEFVSTGLTNRVSLNRLVERRLKLFAD